MLSFRTAHQLCDWLQRHGVALEQWGHDGAKHPVDLWYELQKGESVLQTQPVQRKVTVAQAYIHRNGRVLIEASQKWRDGTVRRRACLPSEKVLYNETPFEAVIRCLAEELGLGLESVSVSPQSIQTYNEISDSGSYPGLLTSYRFEIFAVDAKLLPARDFDTPNRACQAGDPVVSHGWHWLTLDRWNQINKLAVA